MYTDPVAKKGLGQHWLKDADSLETICRAAQVEAGDEVLEIGPGTGELTTVLVEAGAQVTALEYDESLIDSLKLRFQADNVKVVHGDIRTYDLTLLPKKYKIVASIPYYLTAYLLRLLTETANKPALVSLLVQKEVAERVASRPGQMSFISVATQLYYATSLGELIPAKLFTPPPKVDSQVLILKRLEKPMFNTNYGQLLKFIKFGFGQPRKTLANNLSNLPSKSREDIENWLTRLDLSPTIRAQELSLKDWHNLYLQTQ